MVGNASEAAESLTAEQLWNQGIQTPVPEQPATAHYTFVSGFSETVTFAWPNTAPPELARLMVDQPEKVPHDWKVNFFGPPCRCHHCDNEGIAEVLLTSDKTGATRPANSLWVVHPDWYWDCPGCGTQDTLPLDLLVNFLERKKQQNRATKSCDEFVRRNRATKSCDEIRRGYSSMTI